MAQLTIKASTKCMTWWQVGRKRGERHFRNKQWRVYLAQKPHEALGTSARAAHAYRSDLHHGANVRVEVRPQELLLDAFGDFDDGRHRLLRVLDCAQRWVWSDMSETQI